MVNKKSILVVDDEPRIVNFLSTKLRALGYEVLTASNGIAALEQLETNEPEIIVLDIVMPGQDGFETLRKIRALSPVPVIMLSAKETNVDKVKGLGLGADDYLTKPFNPDELVARIEAVRRRLAPADDRKSTESITLGSLMVCLKKPLAISDGKEIPLSRTEWLLLKELAQNAGNLMSYRELLVKVWGPEYRDDVQILRTWISHLRRKITLAGQPEIIRTVAKMGYILDPLPAR